MKKHTVDSIDLWLGQGIDFQNRIIDFIGEVDEPRVALTKRALIKMAQMDHKTPITLFISSFGGSAYDAMALYETISTLPCPVITFGEGKVISSGFIIFLAGHIRVAHDRTTFMMHSVSGGTEGRAIDLETDALESKRLNGLILEMIVSKTNKPKSWWYRRLKHIDIYMNNVQALEYGILTQKLEDLFGKPKRDKKRRRKAATSVSDTRVSKRNSSSSRVRSKKVR